LVSQLRHHFQDIRGLTDQQIELTKEGKVGNANEYMLEAARIHRSTPDYAGMLVDQHRRREAADLERMTATRQGLTLLMVVISIVIIGGCAFTIWRIERALGFSINRQVKQMETMIAGMADGVMLVDGDGKTAYIN